MIKYEIMQSLSNEDHAVSESMLSYIDSLLQLNEKASMYQENYEGNIDIINTSHLFLEADSSDNKNKNFLEKIWDAIKKAWDAIINFLTGNSNKDKDTQKKLAEAKNANPNAVKDLKSKLSSTSGESSNEVKTSPDGKKYIPLVGVSLAGVLGAGYGISLKLKNRKNPNTDPNNPTAKDGNPSIESDGEKIVAVITNTNDGSELSEEQINELLKEERDKIKQMLIEKISINNGDIFEITDDFDIKIASLFDYTKINGTLVTLINKCKQLVDTLKNATDSPSLNEKMSPLCDEIKDLQSQFDAFAQSEPIPGTDKSYATFKDYSEAKDQYIKLLSEYVNASDSIRLGWMKYMNRQNDALKSKNNQLKNGMDYYKKESEDYQKTINGMNKTPVEVITVRHTDGSVDKVPVKTYKQMVRAEIDKLNREIEELKRNNEKLNNELATKEASIRSKEDEYSKRLDELNNEKNRLEQNLTNLANNNSNTSAKMKEAKETNQRLSNELKKASEQNATLKVQNSTLQTTVNTQKSEIDTLNKKIEELTNEQKLIQSKLQTAGAVENVITTATTEVSNQLQSPAGKLTPLNGSPYKQNTSSVSSSTTGYYTEIFDAISKNAFAYANITQTMTDHSLFYIDMMEDSRQNGYNWMTINKRGANGVRIYPLLDLNSDKKKK